MEREMKCVTTMHVVLMLFLIMARMTKAHDGVEDDLLRLWKGEDGEIGEELDFVHSWDRREEEEEDHIMMWTHRHAGKVPVNVDSFGAVGDGIADDTQAFLEAWNKSCCINNAVFLVPAGRRYKVNATKFSGPCTGNVHIQIQGTILAPEEPKDWDPRSSRSWLLFSELNGVRIQGGGVIDGSGSKWWASSCKINKTNPCRGAPTALTIHSSSAVVVKGLKIQSAQQMHFIISDSKGIRISGIHIKSPKDSPNTDGIHISKSSDVLIQNCRIETGDDCISIVNASFNIKMKNIDCGPGHGISIGSLGENNSSAAVRGIVLDTATLTETTNGLRIKTWQGGSGYVNGVRFANVKMDNVDNPIIIDQFYCDSSIPCKNQTSAVNISHIMYVNINGTSKTQSAMKFACSDTVPCSNIVLSNIDLEREDGDAETFCNCAMGFDYGHVRPAADCLKNTACDGSKDSNKKDHTYEPIRDEL